MRVGRGYLLGMIAVLLLPVGVSAADAETLGHAIERYPDKYSFEVARQLVDSEDYSLALWYYINLFPSDTCKVIHEASWLSDKDSDLVVGIKIAFASYAPFDPTVSDMSGGGLQIDGKSLSIKGEWADKLADILKGQPVPERLCEPVISLLDSGFAEVSDLDCGIAGSFESLLDGDDFQGLIRVQHHYYKSRHSVRIDDYGLMFRRIAVSEIVCRDESVCDLVVKRFLLTRDGSRPILENKNRVDGVKSPPFLLVKSDTHVVLVRTRCEDFPTGDQWQALADDILKSLPGANSRMALICYCGGPLTRVEGEQAAAD